MALLVVPVILAVALLLVPALVKILDRNAGWPLALTFFGLAGYIISHAEQVLDGDPVVEVLTWVPGFLSTGAPVTFALLMDPLALFFTLLALLIGGVVFIYSTRYLHRGTKVHSFYLLMTAFMLAVILLVLADDVALLFIGWELVSLASFFLIARSGSGGEQGSIRTLMLTFAGGLLLLVGLGVLVATTGTMRVSEILSSQISPLPLTIAAGFIALAAFSKAAQIPFHFWLPEAMAADTPVSAFLHAAAVVKAGIYLLLRFSGLFAGVMLWHYTLIIVGMTTAVMAAVFAMQKTDLKKLTAYSTVSQLGWIVATIGVGTPFALAAALVHTAAHALFKSSLFMLVGVVDHEAGSRDIRRLGPLWRKMPFTFGAAVIAAASMAALPPTLGFVSKEGMLEAFTEAPLPTGGVIALLVVAGVGALATFLYSARYVFGAFIDGPRNVDHVHEAPISLWLPAALPGVLSLPIVAVMAAADEPLTQVVTYLTADPSYHAHLALWHGFTVPLYISLGITALGVVGVVKRRAISDAIEGRRLGIITGVQLIDTVDNAAARYGRIVASLANSLSPSRHVSWIFAMIVALGALAVLGDLEALAGIPDRVPGIDRPLDLVGLAIVGFGTVSLMSTRSRMASVILVGTVGAGVSWIMLTLGAPDVALTQLLVEFCIVVLIMLIVRHQPRLYLREGAHRVSYASTVAVLVGIVTFAGVWLLTGRHGKPPVADWYLTEAADISGAKNLVAVILVEFRAFDTFGELIVLGMAGIVIAAVIRSIPRSPTPGYGPGSTSELFRTPGSTRFADVHKIPELAPFYSRYLRSTHLNTIVTRSVLRPMLPVLAVLSLVTFWRGHNAPGGGFLAALVAACGLLFVYLARSRPEKIGGEETGYRLIGWGIIVALLTGLAGLLEGSFLTPLHGYILGVHVTTSLLFDVGVYLAVLGLIVVVVNEVGGKERPGADPHDFATPEPRTVRRATARATERTAERVAIAIEEHGEENVRRAGHPPRAASDAERRRAERTGARTMKKDNQ